MKRVILLISVLAILISVFSVSSYGQYGKVIDAVYDIDGNKYKTVKIGDQIWMKENLKVTTFNNGDPIFNAKGKNSHHAFGKKEWEKAGNQKKPAWCYHSNDPKKRKTFGNLYNYYVVEDSRNVCPDGWRVPNDRDWRELMRYVGGKEKANKLKARFSWKKGLKGTNETKFSALAGGVVFYHGGFWHTGDVTRFWSSTGDSENNIWSYFSIWEKYCGMHRKYNPKKGHYGFSIRCIKEK